jgi:hypothetical protein
MTRDYQLVDQSPTAHQRLPEHARDDGWIRDLLKRGLIARIATHWDDQPFITPSTYWYDEGGHRLVFHSNISGRVRANIDRHPEVCVEVSELGRLLPSNVALEFSLQFRSALVFGKARVVAGPDEARALMEALIEKYFPAMRRGVDYRGPTPAEMKRTSVYEVAIEAWSGKENWKDRADQSDEWPGLEARWFEPQSDPNS